MISMKILQISHSFLPCHASGGVVRVVYEISKNLASQGHEVTVYTTDGCTKRLNVEKNRMVFLDGIKVYYFSNLSNRLRIKLKIATPYKMFNIIRRDITKFDVIHIHEHRTILAVIVHYFAKKYEIPYIVQSHGSVGYSQKSSIKKIFDRIWGFDILDDASRILALTETESDNYQKVGISEAKIKIIPNGINLNEFNQLPEKGKFKKKYGIKKHERCILYLGRLNRTKGIDILINQFSELLKDYNMVKLVIVGPDDGYLNYLKKLSKDLDLQDSVIFAHPIYNQDKLEAYVDADIFITPCFSGFPLTFLESCACGTPIITTNYGDKLEWINKVGYVADYNRQSELKDTMLKLLNNEDLITKFGENGKNLVKEKFNWNNISKKIEAVYVSILNK